MPHAAVFFDRDDTLIEDPGYLRDPDGVRLAPGAADAVGRLRRAGYRIIVVTNQSGIARGLLDEPTLEAIHERMKQLFAEASAPIDAIYYCPYLDGPEAVVERYRRDSDLRKPRSGMYALAAKEHDIDLAASWSIGDSARDTEAGRAAGCRTIQLVRGDEAPQNPRPDYCFRTLTEAADCILAHAAGGAAGDRQTQRGTSSPSPDASALEAEAVDSSSSSRPAPSKAEGGRSERLLEEIAEHLRTWQRLRSMEDFTLAKLAGAVAELLAVAAAFWALVAMVDPRPDAFPAHRWLAAIFLQLLALTFFYLHRQR
jgi:D,D-heptose 1,7-bisphosphate phosphatase